MFRVILFSDSGICGFWDKETQTWNIHAHKASNFLTKQEAEEEARHARFRVYVTGRTVRVVEKTAQLILTQAEAEAVYNAMCQMNNVCGLVHARILQNGMTKHVQEYLTDEVNVWVGDRPGNPVGGVERYTNQDAFRQAYGL